MDRQPTLASIAKQEHFFAVNIVCQCSAPFLSLKLVENPVLIPFAEVLCFLKSGE